VEDQVSVFVSPSDGVTRLCPQASGSLSVTFNNSQDYGGGIIFMPISDSMHIEIFVSKAEFKQFVGFEILIATTMAGTLFRDVTQ
jgi:hypothetical protein